MFIAICLLVNSRSYWREVESVGGFEFSFPREIPPVVVIVSFVSSATVELEQARGMTTFFFVSGNQWRYSMRSGPDHD